MTRLVLITLCLTSFAFYSRADLSCGPGEVEDKCPSNCSDSCPTKYKQNVGCKPPSVCGKPECRCSFNNRRSNGKCIPTQECPPFRCPGNNEKYVACPLYCPTDECSQATVDGSCPTANIFLILIVVECEPTCRCIEGYWRKNGTCVPYSECKSTSSTTS